MAPGSVYPAGVIGDCGCNGAAAGAGAGAGAAAGDDVGMLTKYSLMNSFNLL